MATPEETRPRRQLAAILSADAVGYSRRMAEDEAATVTAMSVGSITALVDVSFFIGVHSFTAVRHSFPRVIRQ